jgi:hypothetical protein
LRYLGVVMDFQEVWFLPYIKIEGEFTFGEYRFWSWKQLKHRYVNDSTSREHLEYYFSRFTNFRGNKLDDIVIISQIDEPLFGKIPEDMPAKIQEVVDCLAFGLLADTDSITYYCYDNFKIVGQRFTVGEHGIAMKNG